MSGVGDGTRTRDNRGHNPGLYHLSYTHHECFRSAPVDAPGAARWMVRLKGFEPSTHGLEGRCSIP